MDDNTIIGYSSNDFFYEKIDKFNNPNSDNLKPTKEECDTLLSQNWEEPCNTYFSDNKINCIKNSLCKNKETANQIQLLDSYDKFSNEKNKDTSEDLKNTILNTMNLSIGILFIVFVIYKLASFKK
jgi:hypothetical protein